MTLVAIPKPMALPPISEHYLNWFSRYATFYLRRNFHGFSLLRTGLPQDCTGLPLLVCLNHPSWWDPLTSLHLSRRFFARRQQYAPIAADGLAKYKFFARLGFFAIDLHSHAGAAHFLRIGEAVLSHPNGALWVTPQGAFRDVRDRPVLMEPGIAHLARRLKRFAMLPLALEYAFWNERYPEAFANFGPLMTVEDGRARSTADWTNIFSSALEDAQDRLSQSVRRRDPRLFMPLLQGCAGVGGVYDLWRRTKARLGGTKFEAEHGGLEQ
jgi:1-acyl-sn-glycerol-3-phosphate acyltransferase